MTAWSFARYRPSVQDSLPICEKVVCGGRSPVGTKVTYESFLLIDFRGVCVAEWEWQDSLRRLRRGCKGDRFFGKYDEGAGRS